ATSFWRSLGLMRIALVRRELRQKISCCADAHGSELTERQQILVPGDDDPGVDRERGCNDMIVVRVPAGRADIGQLAVKHISRLLAPPPPPGAPAASSWP